MCSSESRKTRLSSLYNVGPTYFKKSRDGQIWRKPNERQMITMQNAVEKYEQELQTACKNKDLQNQKINEFINETNKKLDMSYERRKMSLKQTQDFLRFQMQENVQQLNFLNYNLLGK